MERAQKRKLSHYFDYNLLFLTVFIIAFGLVMLYSATAFTASLQESDPTYYLKKQLFFSCLGLAPLTFFVLLPSKVLRKFSFLIFIGGIFTVFLLLVPSLSSSSHGAVRWLRFGPISIQPAEIVKISVIIFMADLIPRLGRRIRKKGAAFLIGFLGAVASGLVLFISDNLSSALIILGIVLIMYFVSHPKYWPFVLGGVIVAAFAAFVVIVVSPRMVDVNFRFERIEAWKDPIRYIDGKGYQPLQALYAIGSGGVFGKGLGKSAQKLIIPEAQNDMIFSIICEELGIVGAIAVLFVFVLILYRMLFIAKNAQSRFGALLVIGVFAHISLQVVLNVMVVTGLCPNTGITLPFVSYGGSATICLMSEIGIVLGVSREIVLE